MIILKMHKFFSFIMVFALFLAFVGCNDTSYTSDEVSSVVSESQSVVSQQALHTNDSVVGFQLEQPKSGEKAAVLHTNYGDVYIRLFPELAPKTVENFTGLIEKGYYDDLIFHRIIEGFCVQGGDPQGDGTGGESLWGKDFEDEFSDKLVNIAYSVAMANAGPGTNGSQFFINHSTTKTIDRSQFDYDTMIATYTAYYQQYVSAYGDSFKQQFPTVESFLNGYVGGINPDSRLVPEEVWKLYEAHGGNISLDGAWRAQGGHTVFGQVYAGQDVVDKIAAVEVDENDKPVKDVVIESAEVITVS